MVGFKPWPSWIGRDHSANWAKTTAPDLRLRGHGALYRLKQKGDVFMLNQKIMQCMRWHSSIVVWCWADPVVHLLLLKSSRTKAYFFWGGAFTSSFVSSEFHLKQPTKEPNQIEGTQCSIIFSKQFSIVSKNVSTSTTTREVTHSPE